MSSKVLVDHRHTAVSAHLTDPFTLAPPGPEPDHPPAPDHPPLTAPNYWQETCCWCNLASLTNGAQYHHGRWPSGGLGSTWGETSLWYLAGRGQQPHDIAYFWETTLRAVKMLDANEVPDAFPLTYRNQYLEFNNWLWNSRNPDDWADRWQEFKEYVESVLWGTREPGLAPRPVVLGWHHTRLITGSDGTNVYLNDPGGAQYFVFPWERLRQQVIDKIADLSDEDLERQGYGTLIFLTPPRPEKERRGALWLLENNAQHQGALVLRRSADILATWHWGGNAGHSDGCYFQGEELPSHPRFGVSFTVQPGAELEYQFYVQNTSFESREYSVLVELLRGEDPAALLLVSKPSIHPHLHENIQLGGRPYGPQESATCTQEGPYTGSFDAAQLAGGDYTLKFILYQDSTVQDVKYLSFAVAGATGGSINDFELTEPFWRRLFGLVDDTPGVVINIETGEVKPVPPLFFDMLKYMYMDQVARNIHGQAGIEVRKAILTAMIQTLQKELDVVTKSREE